MSRAATLALLLLLLPSVAKAAPPDLISDSFLQGVSGESFGHAMATAGDVNGDGYSDVLVGAPTAGSLNWGTVYLFYGNGDGIDETAAWSFNGGVVAQCGFSVAPAGDTNGDGFGDFLVGAPYGGLGEGGEGLVYLFAGSASGPSLLNTFQVNDNGAHFGYSVSWAGDVNGDGYDDIMAGAPDWGGFGSPFYIPVQGLARVYHGGPNGPDDTADWSLSGGQTASSFGFSVAGLGDVNGDGYADVMVGAPHWDPGIIDTNNGKVYCYLGSATGLATSPTWEAVGAGGGDLFGSWVAGGADINGDGYNDALIGAPDYTTIGGAFYWTLGSAGGLLSTNRVSPAQIDFGQNLSMMGDFNGDGFADVIVGGDANYANIYEGSPNGLLFSASAGGQIASYGEVVACAGDVDGDGTSDFLINHPDAPGGGIVRLYLGGRQVPGSVVPEQEVMGSAPGESFGAAVASAGDVNGDGLDDFIAGSPTVGGSDEGRVSVYHGTVAGLFFPDWVSNGTTPGGSLGEAVASAGDVDGDGYADIVVGEPGADKIHVYMGSASGLSASPDWTFQDDEAGSRLGASVDGAGDINGDGYADIVAGAPLYDGDYVEQGRVRVFMGSAQGMTNSGFRIYNFQSGGYFGASVAGIGDGDGDGFDDVAIGTPGYTLTEVDQGSAFVFFGASNTMTGPWASTGGAAAGDANGSSIAAAGDVNGDGFADFVVGAPLADQGGTADVGTARIYFGSDVGVPFLTSRTIPAPAIWPNRQWGRSVSSAGDLASLGKTMVAIGNVNNLGGAQLGLVEVTSSSYAHIGYLNSGANGTNLAVAVAGDLDGDGLPEIAMGTPLGNGTNGGFAIFSPHMDLGPNIRSIKPRLTDMGGDPVALRGLTQPNGLRIEMKGWLPTGRTRLRLESQMAQHLDPYGSVEAGSWVNSGSPVNQGVALSENVPTSLIDGQRYRWRLRVASQNPFVPHGRWITDTPNSDSLYGFRVDVVTAIAEVPSSFRAQSRMLAPYPNPFNPTTNLQFELEVPHGVSLRIVNLAGRVVRTLHRGPLEAGEHRMQWDGQDDAGRSVASGSYIAVLEVGQDRETRKLVLVK